MTSNPIYRGKWISKAGGIPTGEHWAIIRSSSVFVPGDERSRTAPGHGYPEHNEDFITYQAFDNEADFKEAMAAEMGSGLIDKTIRGIHVTQTYGAVTRAEVIVEEQKPHAT